MKKSFYFSLALLFLLTACDEDKKYYKEPPFEGGTTTLDGGEGEVSAVNSVYVDFSTGKQLSVARSSWNIAVHCGSEFGIKLNNTIGAGATKAAEGIALGTVMNDEQKQAALDVLVTNMQEGRFADFTTVDQMDCEANLAGTIIKKDIVYILYSGEVDKETYKVSVKEKNSSSYTVSYAVWNSSEVKSVDVAKDSKYNFIGVNFKENKSVNVQPEKEAWDIVWGRTILPMAYMGTDIAMLYADVVLLNLKDGVKAKEMLVEEAGAYADYTAIMAESVTLESAFDVIGSTWRANDVMNGGKVVARTDRFYLIKDAQNNIYKLGFVSASDGDGGRRGYPEIKYALLIEAE